MILSPTVMLLRISLYLLAVFVILTVAGFSMNLADAYKGSPYHIWNISFPEDESACMSTHDQVMDKDGNLYQNPCYAALNDVRVTYKED